MKRVLSAMVCALAFGALFPATAIANPQHERMKRCNAEARTQELKGDERRSFMSSCLKGRHERSETAGAGAAPAPTAQATEAGAQERLAANELKERRRQCNRAATEQSLTGAERKAFVSDCLAG